MFTRPWLGSAVMLLFDWCRFLRWWRSGSGAKVELMLCVVLASRAPWPFLLLPHAGDDPGGQVVRIHLLLLAEQLANLVDEAHSVHGIFGFEVRRRVDAAHPCGVLLRVGSVSLALQPELELEQEQDGRGATADLRRQPCTLSVDRARGTHLRQAGDEQRGLAGSKVQYSMTVRLRHSEQVREVALLWHLGAWTARVSC
jgi:hypothetical protein